ncbi:hypothetical protein AB4Z48_04050 [Cupriavidus sp. 2TAF22]|uniref:hypothetical protein n=1 Tax=unclassified Cupriavidus TaxID=2640874 RepID=UPI003F8EDF6A
MDFRHSLARVARFALASAAACAAAGLAGCMTTTPVYDAHFGEAVRIVRAMQTLNPDASLNTDPVTGVDARSATYAMDRYNQSYRNPPTDANAYAIGVGSGSSSAMSSAP